MTQLVIGTYYEAEKAHAAADELMQSGFPEEHISFVAGDRDGEFEALMNSGDVPASEGAGSGAVFGTIVGLFAGLATIAVPGIGTVVAAGPLVAAGGAAAGAGIGAASGALTGGLIAALVDRGVDEEDANYYAEILRRGGYLVAIETGDEGFERAVSILQRHDPIDMDRVMQSWRDAGWQGFDPDAKYTEEQRQRDLTLMPPYDRTANRNIRTVGVYGAIPMTQR